MSAGGAGSATGDAAPGDPAAAAVPPGPAAIRIRPAVAADAAAIHAMVVALAAGNGLGHKVRSTPDDFRRLGFGSAPAFEALIAEAEGRPVGLCLYFTSFSSWRGRTGLYVQDLYVADAARRTGLGRRLLARTAAIAAARGGSYLRLAVDAGNAAAQRFYERVGLVFVEDDRIYALDGEAFAAMIRMEAGDGGR